MKTKLKPAQLTALKESAYLIRLKTDLAALEKAGTSEKPSTFFIRHGHAFADGEGTLLVIGLTNEWRQHIKKEKWLLDSDEAKKAWLGTCTCTGKEVSLVAKKGKLTNSKFVAAMKTNSAFRKYQWQVVEALEEGDDSDLLNDEAEEGTPAVNSSEAEQHRKEAGQITEKLVKLLQQLNTEPSKEAREEILKQVESLSDALYAIPNWQDYTPDSLEAVLMKLENFLAKKNAGDESGPSREEQEKEINAQLAAHYNKDIVALLPKIKEAKETEDKITVLEKINLLYIRLQEVPLWEDYTDDRIEHALKQAEEMLLKLENEELSFQMEALKEITMEDAEAIELHRITLEDFATADQIEEYINKIDLSSASAAMKAFVKDVKNDVKNIRATEAYINGLLDLAEDAKLMLKDAKSEEEKLEYESVIKWTEMEVAAALG